MFFHHEEAIPTLKTYPKCVVLANIDLPIHVTTSTNLGQNQRKIVTTTTNFDWVLQHPQIACYRLNKIQF